MTLLADDVVYAPANDAGDDGATIVSVGAAYKNNQAAIRAIVAYLVNLNLPSAQTADDIAIAIAADESAVDTLREALETEPDEFFDVSNMGIPFSFRDIDDWITGASGNPSSSLTTIGSSEIAVNATFGPEWEKDSQTAAVTAYNRWAFRPQPGRVYRVTVKGYVGGSNSCTLQAIVAQMDSGYNVTTANKCTATQSVTFTAANTLQSVTFTMSVDNGSADIDLDAVDFIRVGASIGPDAATSTNLRLTQILVDDITEPFTTSQSASDIAALFAADSSALESLKDTLVTDFDAADAQAIVADIAADATASTALTAALDAATTSLQGAVELATDAEAAALASTTHVPSVSNLGSAAFLAAFAAALGGDATATAALTVALGAQGSDVASASTIDLDAATGNVVDVTGTTTITAVTLSQGRSRRVRFTGALTLTNGASLVLPSGADITTAAGDYAVFVGYAAGVVRMADYARADGTALGAGAAPSNAFQVFTSSGTYTPSSGMQYCLIIATGGGGGGGGADGTNTSYSACASGGGAGATAIALQSAGTIGASKAVGIGAGGSAGAITGGDGGDGGDTTISGLTAGGGPGGDGILSSGFDPILSTGAPRGGATATGGTLNIPGGYSTGGDDSGTGTNGAGSFWGASDGFGGRLATLGTSAAGNTATVPGGGGGGAYSHLVATGAVGGAGAPGIVFILEFLAV